jgi:RHS repeat-associated protein
MRLCRYLRCRFFELLGHRSPLNAEPSPRRKLPSPLALEQLEVRLVPSLIGLAAVTVAPDIAGGVLDHMSYTQLGNNANPFHYDDIPLTVTLGDGTVAAITNPTGGTAKESVDFLLDNSGRFISGVNGDDLTVKGKVTINGNTYDGTLLTGKVRDFGFSPPKPTDTEFEIRMVVTGGLLAQQPTGIYRVGNEIGKLIHEPGLTIGSFPQSFSITSHGGGSDLLKILNQTTNQKLPNQPLSSGQGGINTCGCGCTSDSANGLSQSNADNAVSLAETASQQEDITDIQIPGRNGLDFTMMRAYDSDVNSAGPLGHTWDFSYDRRLFVVTPDNLDEVQTSFPSAKVGDVERIDGLDRYDLYVQNPDGSYTAPTGFFTRLVQNPGGSYSERDYTGDVVTYAPMEADGTAQMTTFTDRQGDSLQFQYNSQGELTTVIDPLGRPIQYTYNSQGLLTNVQDYIGRAVTYQYDIHGNLTGETSPAVTGTPNGNDFSSGKTTRYTYSSGYTLNELNGELLTVTAPNEVAGSGPPRLTFVYDVNPHSPTAGDVIHVTEGGTNQSNVPAGGTITYQYQVIGSASPGDFSTPVFQTNVVDRNGNRVQYQFNQLGNIVDQKEFDNRSIRPSDPTFYETRYTYNGDYLMLSQTDPQGNVIQYQYNTGSPDRFQQGNLLSETQLPDAGRGGDQTAITTTYTYEPIYNQVHTMTEPRGNDPSYVPQNGGAQSAARYTTTYTYDYQEGTNFAGLATIVGGGITPAQVQTELTADGIPMGLGDVNGDGRTDQIRGNLIRQQDPTVTLLPGSNEAIVEGTTQQPIVTLYTYNSFSQITRAVDPEGNVDESDYYSVGNPGGGAIDPAGGGYLAQTLEDTTSSPGRDSGTNPTPTNIRTQYSYDAAGNMTSSVDGRGITTAYVYNQLDQLVEEVKADAVPSTSTAEPLPLTAFQYVTFYFYDYNNNLVLTQIEDRGNTSNVAGPLPPAYAPNVPGNFNPPGMALDSTITRYDILDQPVTSVSEVNNSVFLATQYRYDHNGNQVLTIQPEGNATASYYDERNLLFQSTLGATSPPPLTLLAPADSHNYFVRGGLAATTTYNYDANGNLIEVVAPDDTDLSPANNSKLPSGTSSGGNTATTLNDSHQTWMSNQWQGRTVLIVSGTGAGEMGIIASNTVHQLVLTSSWVVTPDSTSVYALEGDRTRFVYDGFDRRTAIIDSVGDETVTQYDPDGNVIRTLNFGPTGGPSPTSDGPDTLPGPVSQGGVIQSANLVNSNLLTSTETLYDELGRVFESKQVLFVNTIPTVRTPDVAEGGSDVGLGSLNPGDTAPIPGVSGITVLGRVADRTEYDRDSRIVFNVGDDVNTTRTFYDGVSRVIRTVDGEGNMVETAYDANSNVIETRETDVSQVPGVPNEIFLTTNFYDSLDRLQESVDNVGQTSYYRYDSRDNLVASADAEGPVTGGTISRRAFPDGLRTVDSINGFGNVTRYYYDGMDRQTMQEIYLTPLPATTPGTATGDGAHIGASIYGVKNDPSAPESFAPAVDTTQGTPSGIIRSATVYDKDSLISADIDNNGNVTLFLYDDLDRRVAETLQLTVSLVNSQSTGGNTSTTLNDVTQSWTTNQWTGYLVEIISGTGAGQVRTVASNSGTQLVVSSPWASTPDATSKYIIATPLNNSRILGSRVIPEPTAATINNAASIAPGSINNQLAEIQSGLAGVAAFFPPTGQVVSAPNTSVTGYDGRDNVLISQDANGTEVFTRYDAVDRSIAVRVFRANQADSFAGDSIFAPAPLHIYLNPSQTTVVTGTTIQNYQYDGISRVTNAYDNNDPTNPASASSVTDAYDSLGRIIEETQQVGSSTPAVIDSAWRADDLGQSLTYPSGRVEVYTYDHLDRLATVADQGAAQNNAIYKYIGVDRVLERLYPGNSTRQTYLDNSGTTDIGYDGDRRPVEERDLRGDNSIIVGFTYTYDRVGNKLTQNQLHDPVNNEQYVYDAAYRLIKFVRPAAGALQPMQSSWKLDGTGNWLSVSNSTTETRKYNSSNELIKEQSASASTSLTYDSNGNQTNDGTYIYTYDFMNRLRTVTRKSGGAPVAVYSYDADGRRIESVITNSGSLNGTTYYYLDGLQEIEERNAANALTQQYVYGVAIDEPIVLDRNTNSDNDANGPEDQRLFYYQNTLYSVYAIADATSSAKILEAYQYDAYGRQTVLDPGTPGGSVTFTNSDNVTPGGASQLSNPYMFTGMRLDAELSRIDPETGQQTGVYFYRARYMDSSQGRFLSRDPLTYDDGQNPDAMPGRMLSDLAPGLNLYEYVDSRPTFAVDPDGLILRVAAAGDKALFTKLLNQLCPEGSWEVTAGLEVKAKDPGFCKERKGKFGPPAPAICDSPVFIRHPTSCKCICNAINSPNRIVLQTRAAAGGAAHYSGEVREVDVGPERPEGYQGKGDPNPPKGNKDTVRANQMIILGHELCGHAVAGMPHPAKGAYTEEDPVVKIENAIRKEHNMGTRTGN